MKKKTATEKSKNLAIKSIVEGKQEAKFVIGIDPDVDKNGVAIVERTTRRLEATSLPFAKLIDYLRWCKEREQEGDNVFIVHIEAGWLNQSNWHTRWGESVSQSAAKGRSQGRNEQVSRLIGEMCSHMDIPYRFIKPYTKCWQGRDRKITHEELASFTGIMGQTNQEARDAALIAWLGAELPINVSMSQIIAANNGEKPSKQGKKKKFC